MVKKKLKAKVKRKSGSLRAKRVRAMVYTCVYKQQAIRGFRFEEPNAHGAKDEVVKQIPFTEIHFSFSETLKINEVPEVVYSQFTIVTKNPEIINKYDVGGIYSDLPIKVGGAV